MPDDFRYWGLQDVERMAKLMGVEIAWMRDCRHSKTEDIENEEARTGELEDVMLKFHNERLARTTGNFWVPRQTPMVLLDDLTIVDGAFIDTVLEKAIPNYGSGVTREQMDSKYYLPSQRDAWRIIEWSQVNTIPWQRDQFDCDDHAEALRHDFRTFGINACGFVFDYGGHAYNILVFADEQYWFVEPQADKVVAIGAGIYELDRGSIRI